MATAAASHLYVPSGRSNHEIAPFANANAAKF